MKPVENEDVVGAAPAGDAPTTSEWSTILLPTKVRLILEACWRPRSHQTRAQRRATTPYKQENLYWRLLTNVLLTVETYINTPTTFTIMSTFNKKSYWVCVNKKIYLTHVLKTHIGRCEIWRASLKYLWGNLAQQSTRIIALYSRHLAKFWMMSYNI